MPSYDFENKETGEIEEHMMSYTKLDQFKKDNPHLKQVILSAPSIDYDGGTSVLKKAGDEAYILTSHCLTILTKSINFDKIHTSNNIVKTSRS